VSATACWAMLREPLGVQTLATCLGVQNEALLIWGSILVMCFITMGA
jgi:hypothetical protein